MNPLPNFSSSIPIADKHCFQPMNSFTLPNNQPAMEYEEQVRNSRLHQIEEVTLNWFWNHQITEIQNTTVFKNSNQLPLTRIRKVMKSSGDVKMISTEAPMIFSKASELFILELTLRSWLQTDESQRRTMQRYDIIQAIKSDLVFKFLFDAIPSEPEDLLVFQSGKSYKETGLHQENQQMYCPPADTNQMNPDILQPYMMNPAFPAAPFNFGSSFN